MTVGSKMAFTLAALALVATARDAHAQEAPGVPGERPAAAALAPPVSRRVGFLVRLNFGFGGDELARVTWSDGEEAKLKAGQLMTFAAGVLYRPDAPWALESTVGYKFDKVNGANGSVGFTRLPLDVVVSYAKGGHRLGAGATAHLSPKFKCEVDGVCNRSASFDTALGAIAQYAYGFRVGVNGGLDLGVRYTRVKYSGDGLETIDGSGFGFFLGSWF